MKDSKNEQAFVVCDICGADNTEFRYRLVDTQIVTCKLCGFSYLNPRVKSEVLRKKLQLWAEQDTVDQDRLRIAFESNTLKLYEQYMVWIERYSTARNQRLLDVGCGVGAFLSVAQQRGWISSGLELGSESAQYAKNERKLDVVEGSLFNAEYAPNSLDTVSMLEVIEHLESPKHAVDNIFRWLKPDGLLFITTPNFDSLYRRVHGSSWWVINCEDEHIVFFTRESLTKLLDAAGLDVIFYQNRGYDIAGIVKNCFRTKREPTDIENQGINNYYDSRNRKESIKSTLKNFGLISIVRSVLKLLDNLSSYRYSPLHSKAEQLIVIARKRNK